MTNFLDRRHFLRLSSRASLAAAITPLWANAAHAAALALTSTAYKAIVLVTLTGGNDGNNTIVSMDDHQYASYASIRGGLALPQGGLLPLQATSGRPVLGLHPAMQNVAAMYNSGQALAVANVGPISRPATKPEIVANGSLFPGADRSHLDGVALWESAQAGVDGTPGLTGWGGRIADYVKEQSGSIPPVFTTANSYFSVGNTVQAVAIQQAAAFAALPSGMNAVIAATAASEQGSQNFLTQNIAQLRARAISNQLTLDQAMAYAPPRTIFPSTQIGQGLQSVAKVIAGRSVTGASRQIFYVRHDGYDHHESQLGQQQARLSEFDQAIGCFFTTLTELGLQDEVMVVTHSDFGRTLAPNDTGGTDHAWGSHHFILGGGIVGQRLVGTMPDMTLGTSQDLERLGVWIPTQSVVQMTAGIASWLGLTNQQVAEVFPDLANFPNGAINLF